MYTPDPERKLNPTKADRDKADNARRATGLQDVIRLIMESPLRQGEIIRLSQENPIPLKELKGANVEAKVAVVLAQVKEAVSGNVKSAEWLCKYAGWEPVKESKVSVESVTFIDDIPRPALEPVITAVAESVKEDDA